MQLIKVVLLLLAFVSFFYIPFHQPNQPSPAPSLTPQIQLNDTILARIETDFGNLAKQRFIDWQALVEKNKQTDDQEKLRQVNDFFNREIRFIDDIQQWGKADYWATPMELLAHGAGDCEDFSIAKYFTLLKMGVDDSKLRITYVKALDINQAHMVLTYYESPNAIPLVLDNLKPNISLATERKDLEPIYSFNGSGLWLAKIRSSGIQVGSASKLNPWADLKKRMLNTAH